MADREATYRTSLGASEATKITLLGHDLASELLGQVSFGELAFWLIMQRRPGKGELRLFEAVLLALADHGFTPAAIAARLTYLSAPDSLQGAVAAGILNGGSRFLGVTENTGRLLAEAVLATDRKAADDEDGWDRVARDLVTGIPRGRPIPGLGHPVHRQEDPRVPALVLIAREEDLYGPHLALLLAIGRVSEEKLGRRLPVNGAGVCGAILADLGFPLGILRGVALLARAAGLVGHLAEEQRHPIANDVYMAVDRNTEYVQPGPAGNNGSAVGVA